MTDFEWPWQYSFPPFFTLQRNVDVRKTQIDAWCIMFIGWAQKHNITQIDVTEAPTMNVFKNTTISRALPADSIRIILDELETRGNLEWIDKNKTRGYIHWRSVGEWGQQIYQWAQDTSRINTVCTLFEIAHGDETNDREFHGLDSDILGKALQALALSGKAELINFDDNQGVKFL